MEHCTAPWAIDVFAIDDEFLPGAEDSLIAVAVNVDGLEDDFSGVHGFCRLAVEGDAVEDGLEILGEEFGKKGDFILVGCHDGKNKNKNRKIGPWEQQSSAGCIKEPVSSAAEKPMNSLLRRLTIGHASDNDLLAYYHSPLAGQPHDATRNASRRQVAILELDLPEDGADDDGGCSLRSRRGLASGLAIVAPSDSSFILLSPPPTAPLSTPSSYCPAPPNHQRSTSESLPRRKFPLRDIGIVGTTRLAKYDTNPDKSLPDMYASVNNNTSLHPPIFQQPTSSPSYQSSLEPATPAPVRALKIMKRAKTQDSLSPQKDPQPAPQTGEKKRAVVPRSTVDPESESVTDAAQPKSSSITSPPILVLPPIDSTLSYAKYEPGVHSTAGPLPPPPRLPGFQGNSIATVSPPPPRPPRLNSPIPLRNAPQSKDIEAAKQALQLPSSVSATLASRTRTMSRDKKDTTTGSTVPNGVPRTVVARFVTLFLHLASKCRHHPLISSLFLLVIDRRQAQQSQAPPPPACHRHILCTIMRTPQHLMMPSHSTVKRTPKANSHWSPSRPRALLLLLRNKARMAKPKFENPQPNHSHPSPSLRNPSHQVP